MQRLAAYLRYGPRPAPELRDGFDDRATATGGWGRAPSGHVWECAAPPTHSGNLGITGGTGYPNSSTSNLRASTDCGFADGTWTWTLAAGAASNTIRLFARCSEHRTGAINEIMVGATATSYTLNTRILGTVTALDTFLTTPLDGDVVTLKMRGPSLVVLINGTQRLAATNGFNMGATRCGAMLSTGTTARVDDLSAVRA